MPVAFNGPPLPRAEATAAPATESGADASAAPDETFALLLHAAGSLPKAVDENGLTALAPRRLLGALGGRIADENDSPPPTAGALPLAAVVALPDGGADPPRRAPGASTAIDPTAMSAAVALLLKPDALPPGNTAPAAPEVTTDAAQTMVTSGPDKVERSTLPARPTLAPATPVVDPNAAPGVLSPAKDSSDAPGARLDETSAATALSPAAQPDPPGHPASAAPVAAPATVHTITTMVGAAGWEGEIAGKLTQVVMLRNDRAEFFLHPAELGPVNVQISFAADQAVVLITAVHATTRDALEQALPYLRDMLANQGITLGQATVQGEKNPADPGPSRRDEGASLRGSSRASSDVVVRAATRRGLVDVFA